MRSKVLFVGLMLLCLSCSDEQRNSASPAPAVAVASLPVAGPLSTATACLFSEIAYCNNPQLQLDKYLPGWKMAWHPESVSGNHAFVATDGKAYVVAIRGSLIEFSWDAFDNWIYQDLNVAIQKDWPYADHGSSKISQGSYRGWDNLNRAVDTVTGETLFEFLRKNVTDQTPVLFTGHSLGGNLATVFASYASFKFKEEARPTTNFNVITFASPAAGNEAFAAAFDNAFPHSVRVENSGDIVAKFPCTSGVSALGNLYSSLPATSVMVGYKDMTVSLPTVFKMISTAMTLLELKNGLSHFAQTNGKGTLITVSPSGKNTAHDVQSWFAEAGYQHGIAQYATALGVPVIDCNLH
jgi:triacylglycerol lipase